MISPRTSTRMPQGSFAIPIYLSNGQQAGQLDTSVYSLPLWHLGRTILIWSILSALETVRNWVGLSSIGVPRLLTNTARRSFQALRLANFLFRPSLDTIQTLLILGNTLQNNGQSDAAWALLGTTVRLAQTLGLHTIKSVVHWPAHIQSKAKALW